MNQRIGRQTVLIPDKPCIYAQSSVVGPMEGQGPLGELFDVVLKDDQCDMDSYEQAEYDMFVNVMRMALEKADKSFEEVDFMMGGDLLNQIISSNFAARELGIPFFGMYSACSTLTASLGMAAMLITGGSARSILCFTGSHFATAERQYRSPLELGGQRPSSAQHTVTGCGAFLVGEAQAGRPRITAVTAGIVEDYGITDANNMGAAMAPAAASTITAHLKEMSLQPTDYDLIITGDLGVVGRQLTIELAADKGYKLDQNYVDCGCDIYDAKQNRQNDAQSGGSGCGCSAVSLAAKYLPELKSGGLKRILFIATGALMSPTSTLQGETIPCVAHAIVLEQG